jgi:hypothetical protein
LQRYLIQFPQLSATSNPRWKFRLDADFQVLRAQNFYAWKSFTRRFKPTAQCLLFLWFSRW